MQRADCLSDTVLTEFEQAGTISRFFRIGIRRFKPEALTSLEVNTDSAIVAGTFNQGMIVQYNPLSHPASLSLDPLVVTQQSAWIEHIPFGYALIDMLEPGILVELGVHGGDSYCAFCQVIEQLKLPTRCFGVDTWQGDKHAGTYASDVLNQLRAHHDPRYGAFSKLMPMTFDAALSDFQDGSIDLLHIDGLHTYEAVRHDFDTWRPKLSSRGVVIFHDTTNRRDDFGVYKLWEEEAAKHPHFEFEHGLGLGVLAVGVEVPEKLQPLLNTTSQQAKAIRDFYARLGREITMRRYFTGVMHIVFQGQSLINQWKQQVGQLVAPGSNDFQTSLNNAFGFAQMLAQDIHNLAITDLNLRRQVQGPQSPRA